MEKPTFNIEFLFFDFWLLLFLFVLGVVLAIRNIELVLVYRLSCKIIK